MTILLGMLDIIKQIFYMFNVIVHNREGNLLFLVIVDELQFLNIIL